MHPTTTPSAHTAKQVAALRKQALAYPETHEDFPWGHSAFKVKGKAFAFVHADGDGFSISVKLPDSNPLALELPFAEPTGYGLGKSGWVTARFGPKESAPLQVLGAWLEESFAAVAPKRVFQAHLAAQGGASTATPKKKDARAQAAPPKARPARAASAQKRPVRRAAKRKRPR